MTMGLQQLQLPQLQRQQQRRRSLASVRRQLGASLQTTQQLRLQQRPRLQLQIPQQRHGKRQRWLASAAKPMQVGVNQLLVVLRKVLEA